MPNLSMNSFLIVSTGEENVDVDPDDVLGFDVDVGFWILDVAGTLGFLDDAIEDDDAVGVFLETSDSIEDREDFRLDVEFETDLVSKIFIVFLIWVFLLDAKFVADVPMGFLANDVVVVMVFLGGLEGGEGLISFGSLGLSILT